MDFNYFVNSKDESIDEVKKDEEFYKFDNTCLHKFDDSYKELYEDIINEDDIVYRYVYPRTDYDKKYILNSIKMWEKLGIALHNVNVFKKFRRVDSFKVVNNRLLNSYRFMDPSNIPLKFKNMMQWDSKCLFLEAEDKNFSEIVFKSIVLPRLDKKCASTIYAHEMAHTQLVTRNGGTNSIFNEETIPILMENIFADEIDPSNRTITLVRNERLVSLAKFINNLDLGNKIHYAARVECEEYIISSLQAIRLANLYIGGSTEIKKEILSDVNKVFDGELIVEDLLNKYEANYNEVNKNVKYLKLTR